MTELFKCVDEQLRKDAAQIAKRVAKQIERGFTIKQKIDWMKTYQSKRTSNKDFEDLLSKIEQEVGRYPANN